MGVLRKGKVTQKGTALGPSDSCFFIFYKHLIANIKLLGEEESDSFCLELVMTR